MDGVGDKALRVRFLAFTWQARASLALSSKTLNLVLENHLEIGQSTLLLGAFLFCISITY